MTVGRGCRAVRAAVFAAVCVLLASVGHVLMSRTSVPWWAAAAGVAAVGAAGWSVTGRQRGPRFVVAVTVAAQAVLHSSFSFAQALARTPSPRGASAAQQWARYLLCGADTAPLSDERAARLVARSGFADRLTATPAPGTGRPPGHSGDAMAHVAHPMGHHMAAMAHHMTGTGSTGGAPHQMGSTAHDMAAMSSWGMLAAHTLAALLSGLWLAWGESAAFRVARALAHWAFAPLRLVLPAAPAPSGATGRPPRPPAPRPLRRLLLVHALTTRGPPLRAAVV